MKIFLSAVLLLLLASCSYQTSVDVSPAYDVYSSYDEKVQGSWAIYIDSDAFGADDYKFDGLNCAAHKYPMDLSNAFRVSTVKTIENIVESVEVVDTPLTSSQIQRGGYRGLIVVKAEDIDVELDLDEGFFSSEVDAEIELTVSIRAEDASGRLFGVTVSDDGDGEAPSGGFCEGAVDALADAAGDALKNTLKRVAERIADARRIREQEDRVGGS